MKIKCDKIILIVYYGVLLTFFCLGIGFIIGGGPNLVKLNNFNREYNLINESFINLLNNSYCIKNFSFNYNYTINYGYIINNSTYYTKKNNLLCKFDNDECRRNIDRMKQVINPIYYKKSELSDFLYFNPYLDDNASLVQVITGTSLSILILMIVGFSYFFNLIFNN